MSDEKDLQALAAQLRQPHGSKGLEVADMMHATNIGMTKHAIDAIDIKSSDKVLELGHGNCSHLAYLMKKVPAFSYFGLEISALMQEEAVHANAPYITNQRACFCCYDGIRIPFEDNYFDKIFTVNTIYFWQHPIAFLNEIYRVLKPESILAITYAQKAFMIQLPFTRFDFELYDHQKIEQLVEHSSFLIKDSFTTTENIKSKTGDLVERIFTTVLLQK